MFIFLAFNKSDPVSFESSDQSLVNQFVSSIQNTDVECNGKSYSLEKIISACHNPSSLPACTSGSDVDVCEIMNVAGTEIAENSLELWGLDYQFGMVFPTDDETEENEKTFRKESEECNKFRSVYARQEIPIRLQPDTINIELRVCR